MSDRSSRPDRYSLWDTIACLGVRPTVRMLWSSTPRGVRLERAHARTARFTAAAAALATPGAEPSSFNRLSEDYGHGVAQWETQLIPEDEDGRPDGGGFASGCMDIFGAPSATSHLAQAFWPLLLLAALVAVVAAPLLPLVLAPPLIFGLRRRITRRQRAALRGRTCPDCRYDLRGREPALPPERFGGINDGPDACPECGSPWPLVPPPTRDDQR